MNWILVLLLALVASNFALFFLILKKPEGEKEDGQGLLLLQNQISKLNDNVNANIKEIIEKVTRVDETGKQMVSFADQLQGLQDILKNPKQRGILGEYFLTTLLKNVLPTGSFAEQYDLGVDDDGAKLIPDAVVFVKEKVIPIDSKFSLENYNRMVEEKEPTEKARLEKLFINDLKNRIKETSKYVRPDRNTMEFAFMFIPHEAVYYDLLVNKIGAEENILQKAVSTYKVIIVSPTSFLAYLQTVLQGLKNMQMEESIKDIVKNIVDLQKHLKSYEEAYVKLGNSLGTVVNHYNTSSKEFKKIDKDLLKITGDSSGLEALTLERPTVE